MVQTAASGGSSSCIATCSVPSFEWPALGFVCTTSTSTISRLMTEASPNRGACRKYCLPATNTHQPPYRNLSTSAMLSAFDASSDASADDS